MQEHEEKSTKISEIEERSIDELPDPIVGEIIARLPLQEIFITSSVSKSLFNFIFGDSNFAETHSSKLKPHVLVHTLPIDEERISEFMYLVDIEKHMPKTLDGEVQNYPYKVSLPSFKFQVPKSKRRMYIYMHRRTFDVVNSCNGFVCLAAPFLGKPNIIWNPLTGEYIWLPKTKQKSCRRKHIFSAFGFSHVTNEYKVLNIYNTRNGTNGRVEINVLGSKEWRIIDHIGAPRFGRRVRRPILLNSVVHWACCDGNGKNFMIVTFDFVREKFGEILLPFQIDRKLIKNYNLKTGVSGGSLSIFESTNKEIGFNVWVMKKYGVQESWSLEIMVRTMDYFNTRYLGDDMISYVDHDNVLGFDSKQLNVKLHCAFGICPTNRIEELEGVTHTPSFLSFRNIMVGNKIKVLKVQLRSRLFGEEGTIKCVYASDGTFQFSSLPKPPRAIYMHSEDDDTDRFPFLF